MKKLLTILAASVGIAAFAVDTPPLSATSFEGYDGPFSVTQGDAGGDSSVPSNDRTWAGEADADGDTNVITAYGDAIPSANRPDYYATSNQVNFLKVDSTAGLARYVNKGGVAQGLTDSNVYFDMDVQFTVSDTVQEPAGGDKLLVWLYAPDASGNEAVATNLIITAATLDNQLTVTPTHFVVPTENAAIEPDTWHRLTVVTEKKTVDGESIPYFQVYLDGNTTPLAATGKLTVTDEAGSETVTVTAMDDSVSSFASLVNYDDAAAITLTSVTFKGTGAVDDLVVTTVKPSFITEPTVEYNFDVAGTGCMTFGEAMNAVVANGTITLLKDYDLTTETTGAGVTISKGVTIALGGKKLSLANAEAALMTVSANVTLTGEGTIDNAGGIAVIVSGGTLTIGTSASDSVTFAGAVACDTSSAYAIKYFSSETPALEVTDGENTLTWAVGTGADAGYYVIPAGGDEPASDTYDIPGDASLSDGGTITVPTGTAKIKLGDDDVTAGFTINGTTATLKTPVIEATADTTDEDTKDEALVVTDKAVKIGVKAVKGLYYGVGSNTDVTKVARPAALIKFTGDNRAVIFTKAKTENVAGEFYKVYVDIKE